MSRGPKEGEGFWAKAIRVASSPVFLWAICGRSVGEHTDRDGVIPKLLERLGRDENWAVRREIVEVLGKHTDRDGVVPALLKRLDTETEFVVRREFVEALGKHTDKDGVVPK